MHTFYEVLILGGGLLDFWAIISHIQSILKILNVFKD